MAGYSGTPLPKKLGIKAGYRIALADIPPDVKAELKDALAGCEVDGKGRTPLDFVILFVKQQSELKKSFTRWAKRLAPAGMLWVSWPKKPRA